MSAESAKSVVNPIFRTNFFFTLTAAFVVCKHTLAVARDEGRSDQPQKPRILKGMLRERRVKPGIVTARSNLQESAHRPNVMLTGVRFNELVDPSDLPSTEPDWHRLPSVPVVPLASRVH